MHPRGNPAPHPGAHLLTEPPPLVSTDDTRASPPRDTTGSAPLTLHYTLRPRLPLSPTPTGAHYADTLTTHQGSPRTAGLHPRPLPEYQPRPTTPPREPPAPQQGLRSLAFTPPHLTHRTPHHPCGCHTHSLSFTPRRGFRSADASLHPRASQHPHTRPHHAHTCQHCAHPPTPQGAGTRRSERQ